MLLYEEGDRFFRCGSCGELSHVAASAPAEFGAVCETLGCDRRGQALAQVARGEFVEEAAAAGDTTALAIAEGREHELVDLTRDEPQPEV